MIHSRGKDLKKKKKFWYEKYFYSFLTKNLQWRKYLETFLCEKVDKCIAWFPGQGKLGPGKDRYGFSWNFE